MELHWKRSNKSCIFGGAPVARTGNEIGLKMRLNMLRDLKLGECILSIGCATAAELKLFKDQGFITVGLDPERKFLLEGKINGNVDNLIQAIGENLPLRDNSVDLILLLEVLEHVIEPEKVLKEIRRTLKPKGFLLLTVPNRFYPLETHGIQLCGKQIDNISGIGLPFFSWFPNFLRKKFERARIYSESEIVYMLKLSYLTPFRIEYLMPTLDIMKPSQLTNALRHIFKSLSKIPIIKKFGAHIIIVAIRK